MTVYRLLKKGMFSKDMRRGRGLFFLRVSIQAGRDISSVGHRTRSSIAHPRTGEPV